MKASIAWFESPARRWLRGSLFGICLAAAALSLLAPARADEFDDLRAEIEQLKQQVTLMQNQMPGASAGGAGGGTMAAQQVVQMQQMSQQMSQLQGQIEQLGIRIDDLQNKFDRAQKDSEFRLSRLEQGGGAAMGGMAAAGAATGTPTGAGTAIPTDLGAAQPQAAPAAQPQAAATPTGPAPLPQSAAEMETQAANQVADAVPEPTAPGTLGTLSSNAALPQAPAGAAEAAAEAAAAATPAPAPAASQDPASIQLPGNTPQEQYDYATGLLQRGAYDEAELALKAFVTQHPKDPLAGNAQYWLGESYYVRSDFKAAQGAFAQGYQKYPKSAKAPDNLLKLGMSLGQTGDKENACAAFRLLAKQFPNATAAIKDRAARAQQRYACTS